VNQLHRQQAQRFNEEEFVAWKNDPITKVFLNYLKDFREYIGDTYKEAFITGNIDAVEDRLIQKEIGKCILLEDLIEIVGCQSTDKN